MFAETDAVINKSKASTLQNKSLGSVEDHQKGLDKTLELE